MNKKITKIKLDKEGAGVYVAYTMTHIADKEAMFSEHEVTGKWKPHVDFTNALNRLNVHLALICEQIDDYPDSEQEKKFLEKFKVTGISIGGEDEHEGITIVGQRKVRGGRVLNLVTPFQKWENGEFDEDPYPYTQELLSDFSVLEQEANEYLGGKRTPSTQMEMDFDEQKPDPQKQLPAARKLLTDGENKTE